MEPPYKRQRLSGSQISDPDLRCRRAKNDRRLKSIFESIFDKYSRDFEGIGDEIDLRTGEIVVNNGHLLNITDETDIGQTHNLSDISRDDPSSEEEDVEKNAKSPEEWISGDEVGMTEVETSLQALYVVNSLVENAAIKPSPASFRESLLAQIGRSSPEEDELADKTIEWVTPREARAIAHEKWQLPDRGPTFIYDLAIEEAWCAPPIKDSTPIRQSLDKTNALMAHDSLRSDKSSPSTEASPPKERQSFDQVAYGEPNARESLQIEIPTKSLRHAGFARLDRSRIPWTPEEEDQLRHLKANTDLTYRRMEHLFPKRNRNSIATKWSQMLNRGSYHDERTQEQRRRLHIFPLASDSTVPILDREKQPLKSVVQKANDSLYELSSHLDDSFNLHIQTVNGSQHSKNKGTSVRCSSPVAPSTSMNCQNFPEDNEYGSVSQHPRTGQVEENSTFYSPGPFSALSTRGAIDQGMDSIDLHYETPLTNLHHDQPESARLCLSTNSREFREDAARRREKLIETLDPQYFEVVDKNDIPSLQDSQRPTITSIPALHARTSTFFTSRPLRSQSRRNVMPVTTKATGAHRLYPASVQKIETSSHNTEDASYPEIGSNVRLRGQPEAKWPKHMTPLERKRIIQVVIPESSMHKTFEVTKRPKPCLQVQSGTDSSRIRGQNRQGPTSRAPESGRDFSKSVGALDNMSKDFCREISDSEALSSSPLVEKGNDSSYTMNQVTDEVLPLPPSPTSILSNGAPADLVSNDELLDELSIAFEPSEMLVSKSPRSIITSNRPLTRIKTPAHRRQRNLVDRLRKKAAADSFSSATSNFDDLSEDELSFL